MPNVKALMDAGTLVPDEVIIGIMKERMAEPDCADGYILDGMPRTIAQAEALEKNGIQIDTVLSIEVPDQVIEERMTGRRTCTSCGATYHVTANPPKREGICDNCGAELTIRKDDKAETVKNRLDVYHRETEPLKDFYEKRGKLKTAVGQDTIAETTAVVCKALGID